MAGASQSPVGEVGKPYQNSGGGLLAKIMSIVMFLPHVLLFIPYQAIEFVTGSSAKVLLSRIAFGSAGQIQGATRCQSSQKVSEFLQFYPASKDGQKVTSGSEGRRLTVLYSWLMAKPQHLRKYITIFTDSDIDVLKVQISPLDLMRPTTKSQVAAKEVCEYLLNNPQFKKIFVYGFSVGAYQFCESVKMIRENPEKYGTIPDRFVGHMWDSPVDVPGASEGMSKSITKRPLFQKWIQAYIDWFMKIRYEAATRHYYASSEHMHEGPMQRPALYVYSRSDTISNSEINRNIIQKWQKSGMTVHWKEFEKGVHCALYSRYKEQYSKMLNDILLETKMIEKRV